MFKSVVGSFAFAPLFLILPLAASAQTDPEGILDSLRSHDQKLVDGKSLGLTCVAYEQYLGGVVLASTTVWRIDLRGEEIMASGEVVGVDQPVFNSDHPKHPLDKSGYYTRTRPAGMFLLRDSDLCLHRTERVDITVDSENNVVSASSSAILSRFLPSEDDLVIREVYRRLAPLGRGFSRFVSRVESVEEASPERVIVVCDGTYFGSVKGKWRLEIDTAHDFTVTSSSFSIGVLDDFNPVTRSASEQVKVVGGFLDSGVFYSFEKVDPPAIDMKVFLVGEPIGGEPLNNKRDLMRTIRHAQEDFPVVYKDFTKDKSAK
ncbi:MAG: hypothetical protein KC944_08445 [Candidatus Omnitrophica bacterium]|nr:hypothetical protein [Candidatus Omnitrophota bacterium]